jgi:ABC-type phosphate/phosphonate transport system substrate-binding protein
MRVRCSEINWDTSETEGRIPKLPKTLTFTVPALRENEDQESLTDELGELLSEKTGFSVLGFNFRIL